MGIKIMMVGAGVWLASIFAAYWKVDITGIWWENIILFSSLQTIGTVLMTKSIRRK